MKKMPAWIYAYYCAANMERRGIGIELKPSYFRQAVKNLEGVIGGKRDLFAA